MPRRRARAAAPILGTPRSGRTPHRRPRARRGPTARRTSSAAPSDRSLFLLVSQQADEVVPVDRDGALGTHLLQGGPRGLLGGAEQSAVGVGVDVLDDGADAERPATQGSQDLPLAELAVR